VLALFRARRSARSALSRRPLRGCDKCRALDTTCAARVQTLDRCGARPKLGVATLAGLGSRTGGLCCRRRSKYTISVLMTLRRGQARARRDGGIGPAGEAYQIAYVETGGPVPPPVRLDASPRGLTV